ncbi:50S ribosomal protein L24 [Candidatus Wirthbacteria bacterium CG2_30_54_11]|uniref:Large ribosomal subunit protein uL24 n=1 Tax=Candidatus Wirthbacteria bacterium CG2_30_54_11 TaxID=1817892 RepID=A0A1J5J1I3_9BACT|nr:ribosomal protein L24 [uncultured bacterium]OIQ00547.1 MAG: 50S ribosomal protein L24 [Candidatus Wirthbacteria bacterium CG2_30_54_11]
MNTIRKGDTVQISTGKDRTRRGKVLQVKPSERMIIVEGLNMVKKHQKPKSAQQPGQIIDKTMPISVEKVQFVCPKCDHATRVGFKVSEGTAKVRYCKKCDQLID